MTYLIKFNKEELGIGAAFGLSFLPAVFPALGFGAAVGLALICAVLWAIGGSGWGRAWRFFGAPAAAFIFLALGHINPMSCLKGLAIAGAVLTFGYGIPDPEFLPGDPPGRPWPDRDEGSFLGRIFYKIAKGNQWWANVLTRAAYAGLLSTGPALLVPFYQPMGILTLTIGMLVAVIFLEGEIVI